MKKESLKDKVAIVTGGNCGIGRGISDALAERGCKVVAASLSEEKTPYFYIKCDISKKSDITSMVEKVIKKYGKIDILVNNAGIYPYKAFKDMTEEDWDKVLNINLKGTFFCIKTALPHIEKQKKGKIINIASIAGTTVGFSNLTHYSASKAAIMGLTKSLSIELGPNIQVNAIAPGAIITPGSSAGMDKAGQDAFAKNIPAKRMGVPEDIGALAAFLASDESDYITGQTIVMDGGYTVI